MTRDTVLNDIYLVQCLYIRSFVLLSPNVLRSCCTHLSFFVYVCYVVLIFADCDAIVASSWLLSKASTDPGTKAL